MLLATKLFIPRPHQGRIKRERLEANLDEIARRKLTLVSAPAGFGKTTLVASWIERSGLPIAWISLDAGDNDLHRFLSYVVAALQRIRPGIGHQVEQALEMTAPLPSETLLSWLVNDLATVPEDFILALDDYHSIESDAVHQALLFLLEYGPPTLHIVATTRVDPPIPLARFRVRGELLELRAADLRFSSDEAREFFDSTMHLTISLDQLEALQIKTEGWIAGLQMAALSLEGRDDIDTFITAFSGADRYVLDYLIEEVLARQPAELVRIMLELSVLDRFNGALVEAATGSRAGSALLEQIERANLFLVPLDSSRQWYRYHHLFGDLLRTKLLIQAGMGEDDQAYDTLHEIESMPIPAPEKRLELVAPMLRTILDLSRGSIDGPLHWAAVAFGDRPDGPWPEDFEPAVTWQTFFGKRLLQLVYARVLIGSGRESLALQLLQILTEELERAGQLPLLLETLVLSAIARQNLGDIQEAIELLDQALGVGAPERFVRVFAAEGEQMTRLVLNHQRRRSRRRSGWPAGYLDEIATASGIRQEESATEAREERNARAAEALTRRELDILQLIAEGHSNRKIAEKLYVSVNTVKTHMSNLFDKLGASSRVEALVKARKEGVLEE